MVSDTSSQSFGWRGKEALDDLQAFTAQVRKLRVRTFIFLWFVLRIAEGLVFGGRIGSAVRWLVVLRLKSK